MHTADPPTVSTTAVTKPQEKPPRTKEDDVAKISTDQYFHEFRQVVFQRRNLFQSWQNIRTIVVDNFIIPYPRRSKNGRDLKKYGRRLGREGQCDKTNVNVKYDDEVEVRLKAEDSGME
ncbi:hypothetical protein Tco_0729368 [Tanacetum coccineum]|uniref:Uncharacterized protein n=1 Tax=Tanacetum coccineum TaxID=301880 RepID=A0ABQ4YPM0_9ASTR